MKPQGDRDTSKLALSVPPIIRLLALGFGVFNILVGYGLISFTGSISLVITHGILSARVWGSMYFILGCLTLLSVMGKMNKFARLLMLVGLFIDLSWLVALMLRLSIGGSFLITALWGFLTFIQALLYVYFFSENKQVL